MDLSDIIYLCHDDLKPIGVCKRKNKLGVRETPKLSGYSKISFSPTNISLNFKSSNPC